MSRKGLIALALLFALLSAGLPLSLEGHVHKTHDEASHCALCTFAAAAVALAGQPVPASEQLAWITRIRPPSQQAPAQQKPAANRTRAPPAQSS